MLLNNNQLKMTKYIEALNAESLAQCLFKHLLCADASGVAQITRQPLDPHEIANFKLLGTRHCHLTRPR